MEAVIATITMTMNNSTAVLLNMAVAVEVEEVEEEEAEEGEVAKTIIKVVIKGIRCLSQGTMTTTTAKEDRCKSINERILILVASFSQASKKIKIS